PAIMRAIIFKLAASRPCGYGTVDLYLRAIARILSELNWASRAVRCKKSSVLKSLLDVPGSVPIEEPSVAAGVFSSSKPLSWRKKISSVLMWPVLDADARQRNCSGRENVMPVEFFAANACGISPPIATPMVGSAPEQQLSK